MIKQSPKKIGRYKIDRELGRGTMGVVYEARDTTLGRKVALKTFGAMDSIAPHEREAFERRFLAEARISATIDDQNVVAVYDVGRDLETGLLFMALEYVQGETLAGALNRGRMPWKEAAGIIAKVARALQSAHSHHIVHRDIKPANIMLNEAGEPKLMDFGIAKASAAQLTLAGQIFGTPAYMSPEQAGGEEVDGRSDIFSLGAVLYEAVTAIRPFEGPTLTATLAKIQRAEPRPASGYAIMPRNLDTVLRRALRKQREARYDSAADLAVDLECLLEGKLPVYATQGPLETVALTGEPPRRPAPSPLIGPGAGRPEVLELVEEPRTKLSPRVLGLATLALVALGVSGVLFSQRLSKTVAPKPADPATLPSRNPTPASTPEASALSIESLGAPVELTLYLTHQFGSASLRVKVDDLIAVASSIQGMPIRNGGVAVGYDGRFEAEIPISAGDHVIQVEIRSGDASFIESSRVRLRAGERRRLVALVDQGLTLSLQ